MPHINGVTKYAEEDMIGSLRRRGLQHIKHNKKIYSLSLAIFIFGAILGGVAATSVTSDKMLVEMSVFFSVYSLFGTDNSAVFFTAVLRNMRFLFFVFLFGFFPITVPLIFVFIGFLGFQFGFATTFFTIGYGGSGILLTILLVWLPRLMVLPIIFHFALQAIQGTRRKLYVNQIRNFMFSASLLVICGLVEAFVFPVILRVVTGLFL